jgi:hypothetical protein
MWLWRSWALLLSVGHEGNVVEHASGVFLSALLLSAGEVYEKGQVQNCLLEVVVC